MSGDDEIVVTRRQGTGYVASRSRSPTFATPTRRKKICGRALEETFGPISFNTWADLGVIALLLFYFDEANLEHPIDVDKVREITERVISTWEDRVGATLEQSFGPIEGRRLFKRYVRTETRSGLYRESTRPEEVPEDLKRFEMLEAELETSVRPDTSDSATLKIYSPGPHGPHRDAAHARVPGASRLRRDGTSDRPPGGPEDLSRAAAHRGTARDHPRVD